MGKEIKFHPTTFYMGIADMLAREVENQGKEGANDAGDLTKVGQGVELEEPPQELALQTNEDSHESKAEEERTQMLKSLDAAGASIHDPTATPRARGSSRTRTPNSNTPSFESEPRTFSGRESPS